MNDIEIKEFCPNWKTTIIASLTILTQKVRTENILVISENYIETFCGYNDIFNIVFEFGEPKKIVYFVSFPRIIKRERGERGEEFDEFDAAIELNSKLMCYDFYMLENAIHYDNKSSLLIKNLVNNIYQNGENLINYLLKAIEQAFTLSSINYNRAYSSNELKSEKKHVTIKDKINYIDQNIKNFIKNDRVYAGLAYLKDTISLLHYGFGSNVKFEETWQQKKIGEFNKVKIDYSPYIIWHINNAGIDHDCLIVNKIIEHLFMLLIKTSYAEPIINLYMNLHQLNLFLNSDTLVGIIEALLKHNEKQLIESAISELKKVEPTHPIVETANKVLRRIQVLKQASEVLNNNISDLQKLNGIEFEIFLENQFIKNSFKVERTKGSGDFGADLIIETTSGTRASIQAKRYKQKVNLKAVQEVVASLQHYQTDFGIVITTSGFFQSAIDLAQTNNVELWDEDKLIQFLAGDFSFSMLSES